MKHTLLTSLAFTAVLASSNTSFAFNTDFLSVSAEAEVRSGTSLDSNWSDNASLSARASLTLDAQISDTVRAVITAELRQLLAENSEFVDLQDVDLEEMIREAYIEVKMVNGSPVAFILGKHEMAFGQNFSKLAMTNRGANERMAEATRKDEVMGITVQLPANFFGMINSIEASVFENGAGDLEIGEMNNVSIRVKGDLTENIEFTASYMNEDGGSDREQTAALGMIYTNGDWTAYVEGVGFIDNDSLADTDFAFHAGAAYDAGHGVVAVEYTWIEDSLSELSVSYETEIANGVTVGPQGTYVLSGDNEGDASLGVVLKVKAPSATARKI
jgi:hypothetical protein